MRKMQARHGRAVEANDLPRRLYDDELDDETLDPDYEMLDVNVRVDPTFWGLS